MKSPDTIVYEQDSQMALSCFHYDSVSFPMQKKKSGLGETTWKCSRQLYYLHSHLKTTVKLHLTVFSEVTEQDTEYVFHIFTAYALCNAMRNCNYDVYKWLNVVEVKPTVVQM